MLALTFARSTASMAFALRFSVLPLIDSIMRLAFDKGVETHHTVTPYFSHEHKCEVQRSAINLQRFTATRYFESELCHKMAKPHVRKSPDS